MAGVGNHKAVVHSFEAAEVVAVGIAGVVAGDIVAEPVEVDIAEVAVVGIAEPAVEDIAEVAAVDIVAEPAEVGIAVALAEVAGVAEVGIAVALVLKNSQIHLQSARSQDQSLAAEQVLALACFVLLVEPLLERTLLLLKLVPGL